MAFLNKSRSVQPETKNFTFDNPNSFADFLFSGGNGDLGMHEALRLYYKCKPQFHAVRRRAAAFASVEPRVWDSTTKEFVNDHPILAKLKNPNPFQSYEALAHELAEFFDVTGNSFPLATGDVKRPPAEIYVDRPQTITLDQGRQTFFYPDRMTVNQEENTRVYNLDEVRQDGTSTARYFNPDRDQEIWQVKDTNLYSGSAALWGISTAQPVWMEIQQFIESNTNNLSILQRGGRPSLGWSWTGNDPMTDNQFTRAREELKKYTGANNAGRQAIIDKLKPEAIGQTMRDMEFSVNRETMQKDIYTAYNIPLALIMDKAMTLDNLKTAEFLFWRDAALPLTGFLFGEISRFLLPRYGDFKGHKVSDMKITFNPFDIEVLKRQRIMDVGLMQQTMIFTDNEMRTEAGFEELKNGGGDIVYKPMNLLPVGEDGDTSGNLKKPIKSIDAGDDFVQACKEMKLANGESLFSDAEINGYLGK